MASDKLAEEIAQAYVPKYLGDAGASELTACDGHRVIAAWLRSPDGIAALAADDTIRNGLTSRYIREYWENTDGAGLTADE